MPTTLQTPYFATVEIALTGKKCEKFRNTSSASGKKTSISTAGGDSHTNRTHTARTVALVGTRRTVTIDTLINTAATEKNADIHPLTRARSAYTGLSDRIVTGGTFDAATTYFHYVIGVFGHIEI